MKFVYRNSTYFLSVVIMGLNIACLLFWNSCICTRPTAYLWSIRARNM